MKNEWFLRTLGAVGLGAALFVAGCSLNPQAGTPVASAGIMTKGSVILNGVRYEDSAASISADDTPKTAAYLADGMRIKLKGTRAEDGLNGTADQVEVENEVRGAISAVDAASPPQFFTVLGQVVFVDANTVYADGSWPAGFGVGVDVEVHGQRNAAGDILASRVEKLTGAVVDELRGVVTGKTATAFGLAGSSATFTWDGSTVIVGGTSFANGDLVEVHLDVLHATRIELEDAEDAEFEVEGEQELQGFVSGFTAHPGSFLVDGQQVTTSAATRFEDGAAADLDNDLVVEAEGQLAAGILYADKIKFKDSMRLQDNAAADDSANLLGKTVVVNGLTEYDGLASLLDIALGNGIQVRGYLNANGTITATRVKLLSNPVDAADKILQGVVTAVSAPDSLVIAGITVDLSGAVTVSGDDDPPADLAAFFARLVANRTVVKVKGTFAAGPPAELAASEVSIE